MKRNEATVSAVMFVYNEAQFIEEMLDSLRLQSYPIHEIIIVDDQSTDHTPQLIKDYKQKNDLNIRYHYNEKKGKNYAFRKGLSFVNTDYFFVCAGDDILFHTFADAMLSFLDQKNLHFAYAKYTELIHETGQEILIKKKSYYTKAELLVHNDVSGYLFSKSSEINDILNLTPDVKFEDWLVAIHLANKFSKVHISESPQFFYRRHLDSATHINQSRSKYLELIKRDVHFYEILLKEDVILNQEDKKIIENRICYFKFILNHQGLPSLTKINKVVRKGVSFTEVIKAVFFKLFLQLKYPRK